MLFKDLKKSGYGGRVGVFFVYLGLYGEFIVRFDLDGILIGFLVFFYDGYLGIVYI